MAPYIRFLLPKYPTCDRKQQGLRVLSGRQRELSRQAEVMAGGEYIAHVDAAPRESQALTTVLGDF
jgi:hypothetical protein